MACKIRPYKPEDRATVRRICCETGFMGNPIEPVFSDRQLFADFFTRYYTDYEPESSLVAIDEETGQLVGYLLGCFRYRYNAFRQNLLIATRVVPKALLRYLAGRYDRQSRRFLYWVVFKSSLQTPKAVPRAAHFHFNLLPPYRTGKAGRRLVFTYIDNVKARGARAVFGQIQIQDDKRTRFFERYGFTFIDKKRITKFDLHYGKAVYVATLCKFFDA
ncbi:MAG: GNAT family acetyltransferase [Verrucomicrobia bacterium]|nr:MAG: GNAT family acetyltransferase [Verrucomicrobiota bacterium]